MDDVKSTTRTARIVRLYHDGPLQEKHELQLNKAASHHLVTVLRARTGDQIVVFNGDGNEYHATLAELPERTLRRHATLNVSRCVAGIPDSPLSITLAQCVSRPERMDICLRQSVELGVTHIQPLYSRHSIKIGDEKKISKKQEHWRNIVISACEQSARCTVPGVNEAIGFSDWLSACSKSEQQVLVLSPTASLSLTQHANTLATTLDARALTLIIGPESGLDNDEIAAAVAHGAVAVNVGQRILRTETAGPACIAILQSIAGDLQKNR